MPCHIPGEQRPELQVIHTTKKFPPTFIELKVSLSHLQQLTIYPHSKPADSKVSLGFFPYANSSILSNVICYRHEWHKMGFPL